jgi:hypothetical protein
MVPLTALLEHYIAALEAGAASADGFLDRNQYAERLSAAGEIAAAIAAGDLGRAASIVNTEARAIGWDNFAGDSGAGANHAFLDFAATLSPNAFAAPRTQTSPIEPFGSAA